MTSEVIQREFEAYRNSEAEARAILDDYAEKNQDLSPEDEARFDALITAGMAHKTRADKLLEMEVGQRDLEQRVSATFGTTAAPDSTDGEGDTRGFDARLLDSIADAKRRYNAGDTTFGADVAGVVDLEKRALADFSDSGALYTTDFATKVAVYQRTSSPWINLAEVINADNGRPLNLPNLTADPAAVSPGEGTAITEDSGTIGSAALTTTAYKTLSYISAEAEEDELVGILGIIAKAQGRSIGLKFGSDLTVALVAAISNGGTAAGTGGNGTAASTFFGYEDLIDLKFGRAVPYRQAGVWVMANGAIKKVRKFKDQQGAYFWQPAMGPGMPDMFDGNPVFEDPYLAAPASATKSVIFGDANAVVIKQMALRVATSADFRFSNDQVALKTVYRAGGKLPDTAALAYLVSANT